MCSMHLEKRLMMSHLTPVGRSVDPSRGILKRKAIAEIGDKLLETVGSVVPFHCCG